MNKALVVSFIRFCRWPNLVMIVLLFLLFDHLIFDPIRNTLDLDSALHSWQFALLISDVLIVTIIGYWLNDYYDMKVDAINRPDRFLVRYNIGEGRFFSWVISLLIIGFGITLWLAVEEHKLFWSVLYPLTIAALWLYAKFSKKWGLLGNILVSVCIACIPFLFMIAEFDLLAKLDEVDSALHHRLMIVFWCFTALIFLLNLTREIAKDLQDMIGDKAVQSKSLPIIVGPGRAKGFALLLLALSASVQWCLFFLLGYSFSLFSYSVLITILVLISGLIILKSTTSSGYAKASLGLKIVMIFGLFELFFVAIL